MTPTATRPLTDAAIIAQLRDQIRRWQAEASALNPRDARSENERDQILSRQGRLIGLAGDTSSALSELNPAKGKTIRFVLSLEKYVSLARTWRQMLCERLVAASRRDQPAVSDADIADIRLGIAALDHGTTPIGRALTALMQVDYPPTWGGPPDVWEATGADAHGHAHGSIEEAQARHAELKPRIDAWWKVIEEALRAAEVAAPAA